MTPRELLVAARRLVEEAPPGTQGVWSRAAAHLARQSLEATVRDALHRRTRGAWHAPMTAQLLCLGEIVDPDVARRTTWAWTALSHACHHHGYRLPPTARELSDWMAAVAALHDAVGI